MKQINLFLVIIIAVLALLPIVLPSRFDEEMQYEFDAPVGLVYDEFYNLRQFSKWQQFTAADSLTIKKFSNTKEEDENYMIWDSEDASIASGKVTIENFSINRFVNYTIKYDGWEKLDSLNVKFEQQENGKTTAKLNYLSQEIPYFYRYFAFFKNPESKFEKSLDNLNQKVKVRLDKDQKEGRLNYGEYRIVELGRTNLLAILIEDLPLQKEMKKVVVPGGDYLLTLHLGPRSKRAQTIEKMKNYAKSKKLQLDTKQLEIMLNDPKETDSLKLISRIYIPIKKQ